MTTPITLTSDEVQVLVAYARGADLSAIAKTTGFTVDKVNGIVVTRTSMNRQHAKELLRQQAALTTPLPAAPAKATRAAVVMHRTDGFKIGSVDAQAPADAEAYIPLSTLDAVLAAGEDHQNHRIRTQAVKVRALLDTLKVTLQRDEQERRAAAAARLARQEAIARVESLKQQLAAAQAALHPAVTGMSKKTAAANSEAQKARRWAVDNAVACPARGRLPESVLAEYRRAQTIRPVVGESETKK